MDVIVGGFIAAFFIFLFSMIQQLINKYTIRYEKDRFALKALHYYSIHNIQYIYDNISTIRKIIIHFIEVIKGKKDFFIVFNLIQNPIDEKINLSLANLDIANKLFSFNEGLKQRNRYYKVFEKAYRELSQKINNGELNGHDIRDNLKLYLQKLIEIKKYMSDDLRKAKELYAITRCFGKKPSFFIWLLTCMGQNKLSKKDIEYLKIELKNINEELRNIYK